VDGEIGKWYISLVIENITVIVTQYLLKAESNKITIPYNNLRLSLKKSLVRGKMPRNN
jgi:hypothetical protein